MNAKPNDFFSDDLSDLLGGDAPVAPRQLPQDDQLARIRQSGIGHAPAAPTFKVTCQKCRGSGRFVSYSGRDCGPCFTCKGAGKFERKTNPVQLERAKERRQEAKEAVRQEMKPQIDWLRAKLNTGRLPDGYAQMLADFLSRLQNGQALTDGQLAVITRGQARDAEYAAKRGQEQAQKAQERQEQVKGIDVKAIADCFQRAQEAGLKRFTLRFDGIHFQVDKHDWAKIWVSKAGYGSDRYGVIQGGVYRPGRDVSTEILARIAEISEDPMAAAKAYAQVTSSCSVCGIELTNKESIEEGMGPICAGRLRRPGAMFVPVEKGDF